MNFSKIVTLIHLNREYVTDVWVAINNPSDRRENPVRHKKRRRIKEERTPAQQSDQPHQTQQLAHTDEIDKRPPNTNKLRRYNRGT